MKLRGEDSVRDSARFAGAMKCCEIVFGLKILVINTSSFRPKTFRPFHRNETWSQTFIFWNRSISAKIKDFSWNKWISDEMADLSFFFLLKMLKTPFISYLGRQGGRKIGEGMVERGPEATIVGKKGEKKGKDKTQQKAEASRCRPRCRLCYRSPPMLLGAHGYQSPTLLISFLFFSIVSHKMK